MKHQLKQRLAALHIEIDETTAERHLATVAAELRNPAQPARQLRPRRIKRLTLVAASMLVLLPGAALAAEGAVPGDLLYPVKLGVERVVSLVDPNIEAEHRIEEVEILIERDTPRDEMTDRLVDADKAVQGRDVPEELRNRLDVVRNRVGAGAGNENLGPDNGNENPGAEDPPQDTPGENDRVRDNERSDEQGPNPTAPSTSSGPPETDQPRPGQSTTSQPPRGDRSQGDATTTTEPRRDRGDRDADG